MSLTLGPLSNECRGVFENFVLLPQMLPCGTRVLSDEENEERLKNLRHKIYLDPPVEKDDFARDLIVNTVLGDKFEDGLFVLLYNNGTKEIKVSKLLGNNRDVYCPWKFVLLHRHVTFDSFHRGSECFPTVATAAAVCLDFLTAQSLIAHNNRRLKRAGLTYQSPLLPRRPGYNTYGHLPTIGQSLFSGEESDSDAAVIDNWVEHSEMIRSIGPQSGGYSPTAYYSEDDVQPGEDDESSDGVNLDEVPKKVTKKRRLENRTVEEELEEEVEEE